MHGLDTRLRRRLLHATAIGAVLALPGTALAQATPGTGVATGGSAEADVSTGEILVTARKQSERLLDVPVNVSALNTESIAKQGVKNLFDLMQTTPSLSYANTGQRTQNKLTARGLGVSTTGGNKVSVFLDGVYIAGDFTGLSLGGLERIEVLKGPQSAVFGRTTFAGAINYVTKEPAAEMTGGASIDVGSFREIRADAFVSAPIIEDKLFGFFSASYYNLDGPKAWTDALDGTHHGSQSSQGFIGKLTFKPTESLSIRGLLSFNRNDDGPGTSLFIDPARRNRVVDKINPVTNAPVLPPARYVQGNVPTFQPRAGDYRYFQDYLNNVGDRLEQWRTYLQAEYEFGGGFVATLTGARNYQRTEVEANAFLEPRPTIANAFIANNISNGSFKDDSLELRVASPQDKPFRYAAGLYYIDIRQRAFASSKAYTVANTAAGDRYSTGSFSFNGTRDKSAFGAVYFDPFDQLTVSGEVRYQEERAIRRNTPFTSVLLSAFQAGTAVPVVNAAGIVDLQTTFKSWLPRINVQYKFTPNVNMYVTYSRGNNPGGFNTAVQRRPEQTIIKEETLDNFELGFKGRLFDQLTVSAAAYYMQWRNQQTTGTFYAYCTTLTTNCLANPSGTSTVPTIYSVIENRGKTNIKGAEIDVTWNTPLRGLTIRNGLSYNDAKYKSFCSANLAALLYNNTAPPFNCASVDGNSLESISKWQNSFNVDFETPIDDTWSLFTRGDWQYQSKWYESELNYATAPAFHIFNARIGFQSDRWTFEVYGKNLSNNRHPYRFTRASDPAAGIAGVIGGTTNQYNQSIAFTPRLPRQFGARAAMKF